MFEMTLQDLRPSLQREPFGTVENNRSKYGTFYFENFLDVFFSLRTQVPVEGVQYSMKSKKTRLILYNSWHIWWHNSVLL